MKCVFPASSSLKLLVLRPRIQSKSFVACYIKIWLLYFQCLQPQRTPLKNFGIGTAVGLLLGLLVGLSASEVVASVVAGLVGLLGTLFGLRSESAAGFLPGVNGERVAGFALAMVVALLVGIYIRTHGLLEPTPQESTARWVDAGLSKREAAQLVAFERTGLVPEGRSAGNASRSKASTGALFSTESLNSCDTFQSRSYSSVEIMTGALEAEGGDWEQLASEVPSELSASARLEWLQRQVDKICRER